MIRTTTSFTGDGDIASLEVTAYETVLEFKIDGRDVNLDLDQVAELKALLIQFDRERR
jgi:hypothetical protein